MTPDPLWLLRALFLAAYQRKPHILRGHIAPEQTLWLVRPCVLSEYLMNATFWVKYLLKSVRSFVYNRLMAGSPGSGKTLLARALPGILPEMSLEESLDVTRIYSVADQLPAGTPLIRHLPFRAPHHTISHAGLAGRGNIPKPGEISLALRGVLFLDEFPEFGTRVLELMRQAMEDKVVTISRAKGSLTFSANFQLIAAMNPCPCGGIAETAKSRVVVQLL